MKNKQKGWTKRRMNGRAMLKIRGITAAVAVVFLLSGPVAFASGQGSGGSGSNAGTVTQAGFAAGAEAGGVSENPSELDLREANVTQVSIERSRTGAYRFSVTLVHDDDGEDGYANWWQVETLAGDQLGRRKLLHAHGTQEFTRSETIEIPSGVRQVVVRGHDQVHGYGGQAAVVDMESGDIELVKQGPEPQSFESRNSPQ